MVQASSAAAALTRAAWGLRAQSLNLMQRCPAVAPQCGQATVSGSMAQPAGGAGGAAGGGTMAATVATMVFRDATLASSAVRLTG